MGCTQSQHADLGAGVREPANGNGTAKHGSVQASSPHGRNVQTAYPGRALCSGTARQGSGFVPGKSLDLSSAVSCASTLASIPAQDQLLAHKQSKASSASAGGTSQALQPSSSGSYGDSSHETQQLNSMPLEVLVARVIAIVGSTQQAHCNGMRSRLPEHKEVCEAGAIGDISRSWCKEDQAIVFHLVRMKWTPFASLDYPGLIRLTQPADVQAQPQAAATAGGGGPLLQAPNSMPMMYVPAAPSSSGYPPACQHSYTQPQACVSSTPDLAKIRSGSTNINPSNQHLVPAAHSNGSGGPPTASNARSSGHAMHIGQPSPLSHRSSGGPPEVVQHQAYHPGFPPKRQSGPGVISMPAAAGGLVNSSSRASTPSASVAHQLARQNQHLQAKLQQQQLLQQQQHAQRNGHMNGGQLGAANVTSSLRTGAARVPPQFSHLIHNGVSSASSSGPGSPLLAAKASQASGPTSASSSAVSIAGGALSNGNSRHGSTCLPAPPFPTSSGLPAPLSASAHPIAVHVTAGNGYAANANRHASGSATPSTYWSSNPVPVAAPVMAAHAAQAQNAAHHSAGPSHAAGPSHMATAAPAGTHTAQVRSAWEADKQQAQGQGQPGRAVAQRAGGTQQTHGAVSRLAAAGQGQVAHGPDSNNTASGLSSPAASYICHTDSTGGSGQDAFGLSTGGCTDGLKSRGSAGVAGASGMSSTAALGLQRSNSSASTVVINDGILILPNDLEGGPQIVLEPRGAFRYLSLVQQKYLANLIRRRWTPFEEIATGRITYLQL